MSAGKRVLLVDDETPLLEMLSEQLLLHEEFVPIVATSGAEALNLSKKGYFDVIILDLSLPDMDGREVCRLMRSGGIKSPIIILTGADSNSYELPFKALKNLIDFNISCNACLMISFSTKKNIDEAKKKLSNLWPGLLKSLELEHITLFPKVASRLKNANLMPITFRHGGKIRNFKEN